jgi:hypothetical protein
MCSNLAKTFTDGTFKTLAKGNPSADKLLTATSILEINLAFGSAEGWREIQRCKIDKINHTQILAD